MNCRHLVLCFTLAGAVAACSPEGNSTAVDEKGECIVPSNPWAGDGGGHEAGFNWAEENHDDCPNDHGESFEEGCVEYYNQLNRYEACEASKHK